jgi:NADH dehydrogenase
VVLLDASERVLSSFPEVLSRKATASLERLGVRVRTGELVAAVDAGGVELRSGERIEAGTVLWAAGVAPSPLARELPGARTRDGRVLVAADLSLPEHPEVFVAGDLAAVRWGPDGWVPGMAPGAIQMGRHAASTIARELAGRPREPFRYRHKGLLATIGRSAAVADVGGRRFSGFPAWLLWVFVHVFWLIGFRERLLVLFEWAWAWLTWQRTARVIVTREDPTRDGPEE